MAWKQHENSKGRLLAVLFLFFNCVCTAAPVLKFAGEKAKDAVSTRLVQVPHPLESEEENHAVAGYLNSVHHFSVRKHFDSRVYNAVNTNSTVSLFAIASLAIYIPDAGNLPMPGNHAFLFRYTLF